MDERNDRRSCEDRVEDLASENETLRDAADTFGALAERLNEIKRGHPDAPSCPRCGRNVYVETAAQTSRGHTLHCTYCGNLW